MGNQTLINNKRDQWMRYGLVALVMAFFCSFAATSSILPIFAAGGALNGLVQTVVELVTTAASAIGVIIIIWGVFQIILAFRREDSEGISKQITTVAVGGILIGFGTVAQELAGLVSF